MKKKSKLLKGYIFVILSGVLFGLMPLMTKFIYADGVNALSIVFLRNAISLPLLGILAFLQCGSLKVPPKALPAITAVSLSGCCLTPFLLFLSYNYMASSAATVLHFIYPALVVIGATLFFNQKPRLGTILSVVICLVGICMFYEPGAALNVKGSIIALLSGLAYATYVLLLNEFKYKNISGFLFSFYISLSSTVVLLVICIVSGGLILPATWRGWLFCLLLAIAVNIAAVVFFQKGTFLIGGQRAAILGAVEPLTGVVVGVLFLNEIITPLGWIGSFLVISAGVLLASFDAARAKKEEKTEKV